MHVFFGFTEIFLRVLVEGLLAPERTEIIGLPLVLGLACGGGGVNIHAANGIVDCVCHWFFSFPSFDYLVNWTYSTRAKLPNAP